MQPFHSPALISELRIFVKEEFCLFLCGERVKKAMDLPRIGIGNDWKKVIGRGILCAPFARLPPTMLVMFAVMKALGFK